MHGGAGRPKSEMYIGSLRERDWRVEERGLSTLHPDSWGSGGWRGEGRRGEGSVSGGVAFPAPDADRQGEGGARQEAEGRVQVGRVLPAGGAAPAGGGARGWGRGLSLRLRPRSLAPAPEPRGLRKEGALGLRRRSGGQRGAMTAVGRRCPALGPRG